MADREYWVSPKFKREAQELFAATAGALAGLLAMLTIAGAIAGAVYILARFADIQHTPSAITAFVVGLFAFYKPGLRLGIEATQKVGRALMPSNESQALLNDPRSQQTHELNPTNQEAPSNQNNSAVLYNGPDYMNNTDASNSNSSRQNSTVTPNTR